MATWPVSADRSPPWECCSIPLPTSCMITAAFITLVQVNPHIVQRMGCGAHYRARVPGKRSAFHRRLGGLHHSGKRPRQDEDGGADRFRGGSDPRHALVGRRVELWFVPPLSSASISSPRWRSGSWWPVPDLRHRLLRRLLEEDRPQLGAPAPPFVRPLAGAANRPMSQLPSHPVSGCQWRILSGRTRDSAATCASLDRGAPAAARTHRPERPPHLTSKNSAEPLPRSTCTVPYAAASAMSSQSTRFIGRLSKLPPLPPSRTHVSLRSPPRKRGTSKSKSASCLRSLRFLRTR